MGVAICRDNYNLSFERRISAVLEGAQKRERATGVSIMIIYDGRRFGRTTLAWATRRRQVRAVVRVKLSYIIWSRDLSAMMPIYNNTRGSGRLLSLALMYAKPLI